MDWDLTDRTTHVVVSDRCGAGLRAEALSAAGGRSRGGGGSARAVSIGWVLESYGTGTTADEADHPPAERGREEDERGYDGGRRAAGGASSLSGARRRSGTTTAADDSRSDRGRYGTSSSTPPPPPHPSGRDDDDGAVANANAVAKEEVIAAAVAPKRGRGVGSGTAFATASTPPPRRPNPPLRSRIFRGAAFVVSRLGPPPESTGTCADFGPRSDLEAMISDHGGHVLSRRIVDALLKDAAVKKHDGDDDDDDGGAAGGRICYAVSSYGTESDNPMSLNPLLRELKAKGACSVSSVTPVWVRTCCLEGREFDPDLSPRLFRPSPWPVRVLGPPTPPSVDKLGGRGGAGPPPTTPLRITVTGILGPERTGTVQLLRAMGAHYTESMKRSHTHLICGGNDGGHHPDGLTRGGGPKFEKAGEWGLHRVSEDWIFHVARFGIGGRRGRPRGGAGAGETTGIAAAIATGCEATRTSCPVM